MSTSIQILVGSISTILLGLLVCPLIKYIKGLAPLTPPSEDLAEKWKTLTKDANVAKYGKWLGRFEQLLFFAAVWLGSYVIIAGWLAFKVASKWEVWGSIVSIPDKLGGVDDLDYLIARHRWGSQRLMSFLIGTIANILVAFAGMLIGRFGYQLVQWLN